jgi:hypothetical protein
MVSKPDRPASIEHEQAFMDRRNEIVDVSHTADSCALLVKGLILDGGENRRPPSESVILG